MNLYLTFAILLSTALLQSTVMPHITVLDVHPDLMLMVVVAWSILRGSEEGMVWAVIGGVALDLLSGAPFGICTLALLIVSFLAGLSRRSVFRSDLLLPLLIIPPATLLYEGFMLVALRVLGWPADLKVGVMHIVLPALLVNTLGMPPVYLMVREVHRRTRWEGLER